MNVTQIQTEVQRAILSVGGYFGPLTAVARLLEELGEFAGALRRRGIDSNVEVEGVDGDLALELADIFIISTCIANQYCSDLKSSYQKLGLSVELSAHNLPKQAAASSCVALGAVVFLQLVEGCSTLARIISHHEGEKLPKPGELHPTIEETVATIHAGVVALAGVFEVDLSEAVLCTLEKMGRRDRGRFPRKYDPTTTAVIERFENIKHGTQCIFAKKAKVWGAPEWDVDSTVRDNIGRVIPSLLRFLRVCRPENLDGFVIEVPSLRVKDGVDGVAIAVRTVLSELVRQDPTEPSCLQDVSCPDWQFTFSGERLFAISFAPSYPSTSARHAFGLPGVYVFLQPEHSFDHWMAELPPEGKQRMKERIRTAFELAGRGYRGSIIEHGTEAERYVKPLEAVDAPVHWWRT